MLVTTRALTRDDARAGRIALRGGADALTYGDLWHHADAVRLASAAWPGGGGGTPFAALVSDDSPHAVATFLGLNAAGWAVGVLDRAWSPDEVRGALAQLAPAAFVSPVGPPPGDGAAWSDAGHLGAGWRAWTRGGTPGTAPAPSPDDTFYVGFTSGTSGRPKAFARSHRSWWESFARFTEAAPPPAGTVIVPGPLSSSHFLFGALHGLHEGATVHLGALASAMAPGADEPPGAAYVVPTMLAALCERTASPGERVPAVFYCAGARLEAAVRGRVRERFPAATVVEYYGASELSFVTLRRDGDATPAGSVGSPFPGVELSVRDGAGNPVPPGTTGTIHVRSPLVFQGYRGVPPEGAAAPAVDGWLTVGDRGRVDEAGHVWVDGRGSALIITGGTNVQPEEVEEVVAAAPGVAACVVVGIPDPARGEVVCACVVPAPGALPDRKALRAHVAARLAPAKRPRRWVHWTRPVPLTRSGKVDRAAVAAALAGADAPPDVR